MASERTDPRNLPDSSTECQRGRGVGRTRRQQARKEVNEAEELNSRKRVRDRQGKRHRARRERKRREERKRGGAELKM